MKHSTNKQARCITKQSSTAEQGSLSNYCSICITLKPTLNISVFCQNKRSNIKGNVIITTVWLKHTTLHHKSTNSLIWNSNKNSRKKQQHWILIVYTRTACAYLPANFRSCFRLAASDSQRQTYRTCWTSVKTF